MLISPRLLRKGTALRKFSNPHHMHTMHLQIRPAQLHSHLLHQSHSQSQTQQAGPSTSRYKCPHCQIDFSHKSNRRRHVRTMHNTITQFSCDQCEMPFARKDGMQRHKRIAHGPNQQRHPCDICLATFSTKSTLKAHKKNYHRQNRNPHS